MRIVIAVVASAALSLVGCAQTAGDATTAAPSTGMTGSTAKNYGIYRNPHGYCRLALRDTALEKSLKEDFWRSMGFYATAADACKRLGARGCGIDQHSCDEPPST